MKIRNSEIRALLEQLSKYAQTTHPKLSYWAAVNALRLRKCLEEVERLASDGWPTESWKAWLEASRAVAEAHAERDANDAIVWREIPGGKQMSIRDVPAFNAEIEMLQKEHGQAMADHAAYVAREAEILSDENEFREHRLAADVAADAGILTAESLANFIRAGLIEEPN